MGWIILLGVVALIVATIYTVIRRGGELKQLLQDGVAVTGRVTHKHRYHGKRHSGRGTRVMTYTYLDGVGREHSRKSMIPISVWERYEEGAEIELVYSRSQPAVSAPAYLVEQAREAMGKKGV